jgi:serine/threonine-protein kinase
MRHLSDRAIHRLKESGGEPDLGGTRYRLLGVVGRGGMGKVYATEDEVLQRRIALKVLDEFAGEESAKELAARMMREARVLARLEHPGIVPVHDVGVLPDGRVYYTMKFVEGQRLDLHLSTLSSLPDRLRIFLRICDAVGFAHSRGVLHRDLKPANVMVGPFGEVLVLDWGLAKILDEAQENRQTSGVRGEVRGGCEETTDASPVTVKGSVMGTPGYMSPEQAQGDIEEMDARSDIFSLGAMLRQVMGQGRKIKPLEAICEKACATQPEARYAEVSDLAQDVSRYLDGLRVLAYREGLGEKIGRFYQRNRFFILLIAAYLLVRVALLIFFRR